MCLRSKYKNLPMCQYVYASLLLDEEFFGLQSTPKSWCHFVFSETSTWTIWKILNVIFFAFLLYAWRVWKAFCTYHQVIAQSNWWICQWTMDYALFAIIVIQGNYLWTMPWTFIMLSMIPTWWISFIT